MATRRIKTLPVAAALVILFACVAAVTLAANLWWDE